MTKSKTEEAVAKVDAQNSELRAQVSSLTGRFQKAPAREGLRRQQGPRFEKFDVFGAF